MPLAEVLRMAKARSSELSDKESIDALLSAVDGSEREIKRRLNAVLRDLSILQMEEGEFLEELSLAQPAQAERKAE